MRLTPVQLVAWWPRYREVGDLSSQVDSLLQAAGFSVGRDEHTGRDNFGWSVVALDDERCFFSLLGSRDGPWMCLQVKTKRHGSVGIFDSLFRALIEASQPDECVLCLSNAESLSVLAQEWCKGGLAASVIGDSDPPVVIRLGDPNWFDVVGPERRYFSQDLLTNVSVDPAEWANRTAAICSPLAAGFVFNGGWDAAVARLTIPKPIVRT